MALPRRRRVKKGGAVRGEAVYEEDRCAARLREWRRMRREVVRVERETTMIEMFARKEVEDARRKGGGDMGVKNVSQLKYDMCHFAYHTSKQQVKVRFEKIPTNC